MNRDIAKKGGLGLGFVWEADVVAPDGRIVSAIPPTCNLMPQQMIDHIVGMIRNDGTVPIGPWFIGIYENNYVPDNPVLSSELQTVIGECQAYSETTRPEWVDSYDGVGVIDNIAARAEFTMTQAKTIYGSFLISSNVKGGNTGLIPSIVRYPSPQVVPAGFVFRFAAGLTIVPTNLI